MALGALDSCQHLLDAEAQDQSWDESALTSLLERLSQLALLGGRALGNSVCPRKLVAEDASFGKNATIACRWRINPSQTDLKFSALLRQSRVDGRKGRYRKNVCDNLHRVWRQESYLN